MVFQPLLATGLIIVITVILLIGTVLQLWANRFSSSKINWILRTVIVIFMGLLLLRPGFVSYQEQDTYTNEYDIYFIVDSSGSMLAEDWQEGTEQTRLDAAKADIASMVEQYPDARYSLITADSKIQIRTPLTRDSVAFMSAVEYLQPEATRYSVGSNPNLILTELGTILSENSETSPDRATVAFFLSDGEVTSAEQENGVEGDQATDPAPFITAGGVLGYGTEEGGKMKIQQGNFISNDKGYIQDPSTNTDAISKIDEANLNSIADALDVPYVHRTVDEEYIAPGVESALSLNGSIKMNSVTDYSWVVSLIIFGLLLVDAGLILRRGKKEVFVKKQPLKQKAKDNG